MNQRIKKLWIKALRSGKFKQTTKMRKKVDGEYHYCCLGVLEQIRCEQTGGKFTHAGNLLAKITQHWAGLKSDDPVLCHKSHITASEYNDDGETFRFIASKIEKRL